MGVLPAHGQVKLGESLNGKVVLRIYVPRGWSRVSHPLDDWATGELQPWEVKVREPT